MAKQTGKTRKWLLLLKLSVGLGMLWFFLPHALRPYLLWYQEQQDVNQMKTELADLRARNQALNQQLDRLSDPAGLEVEARRQGWLREGERLLLVLTGQ